MEIQTKEEEKMYKNLKLSQTEHKNQYTVVPQLERSCADRT